MGSVPVDNGGLFDTCQANSELIERWLNSTYVKALLRAKPTAKVRLVGFDIRPWDRLGIMVEAGLLTGNAWIAIPDEVRRQIGLPDAVEHSYVEFCCPR